MASFPLFKDISKSATDLLKKGYTSAEKYSFRVEVDSTSEGGIQATPFIQNTLDKTIEGELKAKFPCKDHLITTTGNLKEEITFEISPAKHSGRGIKWTANLSSNMTDFVDKAKAKLTFEFKRDFTTTTVCYEHPFKQGAAQKSDESKVVVSSVVGSKEKGISGGFEAEIALSSLALKNLNAAIALNKDGFDLTFFMKKKIGGASSGGVNYVQKVKSDKWKDAQMAAELSYDFNDKSSALVLAASYKPTDSSNVKARFDSKGLLGFVYTEKWSGPLSVTFGSDWNILAANATPFQTSIKLAFK